MSAESHRLTQAIRREEHWRRWGPYLSERSWGTVREDYSDYGTAWEYFPFEQSHLRAYRWGEDGLCGISDNHQRLCFSIALWNGRDSILKERLFGVTGNQGNHGEDCKELYYYLDATPTYSYMKSLYKYPQARFPYEQILAENQRRSRTDPEYEILDTGVFDQNRYFDVTVEYAKIDAHDILIRISVTNRGPEAAPVHLLPTLWFRNTWNWQPGAERPRIHHDSTSSLYAYHPEMRPYRLQLEGQPETLFTENETNALALWGMEDRPAWVKDAFHRYVILGDTAAVNPEHVGTKAAALYRFDLAPGQSESLRLRLASPSEPSQHVAYSGPDFDGLFDERIQEANEFYATFAKNLSEDARNVQRQAFAGLLWSKQFYHLDIHRWLEGDPGQPVPPKSRLTGRNSQWQHLYNDDILSMPDKWEYPWYAAWDLAFHMIPLALIDPDNAKSQLKLFLREWYMHPNGQIPAYEWAFGDVNPPVHAFACWRVFQIDRRVSGKPDYAFLEACFHKLMLNFTWWVNRKDATGNNIFEGGFLGLDNIGLFDRSAPLPGGGVLEQSDGTSWMAMYCLNLLRISLELAVKVDPIYEDVASKFFEHFLFIASAMNGIGDEGLWDEQDGFFYDRLKFPNGNSQPLRIRSMVGLIPLFAVATLDLEMIEKLPGFRRRMEWFMANRPDLCANIASLTKEGTQHRRLLSVVGPKRLARILEKALDEQEFLSPHGFRSLSRFHAANPCSLQMDGTEHRVAYEPAESATGMFGGNSNWRGPIWLPVNYLLIEALQKFHHYFGDSLQVEFPAHSGAVKNLSEVATLISQRLSHLFLRDANGRRPCYGGTETFQNDPNFRDLLMFHEYFHGDNGAGLGASHQTGWTALVAKLLEQSGE